LTKLVSRCLGLFGPLDQAEGIDSHLIEIIVGFELVEILSQPYYKIIGVKYFTKTVLIVTLDILKISISMMIMLF
jgi:hypothetical protein